MDKALSVYLENKFKLYPKYSSMIARRRAELECRKEVDESLSTSKSNYGNHEENKRVKILDDLEINNYYRLYNGVKITTSFISTIKIPNVFKWHKMKPIWIVEILFKYSPVSI